MTAGPSGAVALTDRQRALLWLIQRHDALFGQGPGRALVARKLGISVQAVDRHVAALVRKGLLSGLHSPLTLTEAGRHYPLGN